MKVYKSLEQIKEIEPTAIALGSFDGVHLGHKAVIEEMINYANDKQLKRSIFTFDTIPKQFGGETSLLMSIEEKLAVFETYAVDNVFVIPFDKKLKEMTREQFCDVLQKQLNAKMIAVGQDFRFGFKAAGNVEYLRQFCNQEQIALSVLSLLKQDDEKISSTAIRAALAAGDIKKANTMLGYQYFLKGKVKMGKKMGRKLGFATANLIIANYMTALKTGVYITQTKIGDDIYHSVSNVGYNPTFEQKDFNIETHILNFEKKIYGEIISVSFIKRLRDEMRFANIDELKEQIFRDIEQTKQFFAL